MRLVFDLEANGFYEEADTVWCICTKNIETKTGFSWYDDQIEVGIHQLESADLLIGHNIIDYDLRLIKKLYPFFNPKGKILDTMLLSQLLQPDRAGGHSLEAAGERQGRAKPIHEDWSQFSPEMLHRCSEDVEINAVLYDELIREAYEPVQGIPYEEIFQ